MTNIPTMYRRRDLPLLAGLAAGVLGASAYAAVRDELRVAIQSDIRSFDPSADSSEIGIEVFVNVFDQLTIIGADGTVLPRLATSWTASTDATVWTFTIRTDATFHDGTRLTLDDVVWSYEKILNDPRSPPRAYISQIKTVEKQGADKVVFTLLSPFAPFDRQVSTISVLPRAAYEAMGPVKFSTNAIGSGPYKLIRWVKDDRIDLEAFPGYWGGKPPIAKVSVRPIPSESSRVAALQAGDLDIVSVLPPAAIAQLQANKSVHVVIVPSIRIIYLGFNMDNPALKQLKLRQAIDMAIDRTTITKRLLRGLGKPEGQLVAPVTFGYDPEIQATVFDQPTAKQLVKESGYDGQKLLFQYPNNRWAYASETAQAIAGYLQAAGVNVELQGMEYNAMMSLWFAKTLPAIHMFGFGPTIMDATLVVTSLFVTRALWQDPETIAMVAAQRETSDLQKRREIISKIWHRMREYVPYSVLYNEFQAYGIVTELDWTPRPDEEIIFNQAKFRT